MAKLAKQFATRPEADEVAREMRKKYVSVVVFPIGGKIGYKGHKGPWGIAYNPEFPAQKAKNHKHRRK